MEITNYSFVLIFLPIAIIGWRTLLNVKYKNSLFATLYLVVTSLWFIGSYDYRFVIILCFTVLINYYAVRCMNAVKKRNFKNVLAACMVIGNISVLFVLKYANWVRSLFGIIGSPWNLILPIGISFYTLEQIMYIVDSYKNGTYYYSFIDYLSYSAFFPVIVSGPLFRHSQYMEQLEKIRDKKIPNEKVMQGMISFSFGFGKKVLIASQLGNIVDFGYENIGSMSTGALIICIVSYALQLYFDFSGYCNIVEGVGLMMGFELPLNFMSPYKSASINEFWKRWHKTLTRFFTEYVYIPLGGNRKGKFRQAINILVVFLVSGLWHGAEQTFVLWGGLHGIFMILDRYIEPFWSKIWTWLRKGITFILVTILWIPFRADSLDSMISVLNGLKNFDVDTTAEFYQTMLPRFTDLVKASGLISNDTILIGQKILMIVFIAILLIVVFAGKDVSYLREKNAGKVWIAITCGIILSLSVMQFSEITPSFIYEGF